MTILGSDPVAQIAKSGPSAIAMTAVQEGDLKLGASRACRSDMSNHNLERELATYQKALPNLMAEQGKFVLIVGDDVLGTFESYGDALTAGYKKAGLNPFLVKRISTVESIAYFTRALDECRA
jgi:hypothetical protein